MKRDKPWQHWNLLRSRSHQEARGPKHKPPSQFLCSNSATAQKRGDETKVSPGEFGEIWWCFEMEQKSCTGLEQHMFIGNALPLQYWHVRVSFFQRHRACKGATPSRTSLEYDPAFAQASLGLVEELPGVVQIAFSPVSTYTLRPSRAPIRSCAPLTNNITDNRIVSEGQSHSLAIPCEAESEYISVSVRCNWAHPICQVN